MKRVKWFNAIHNFLIILCLVLSTAACSIEQAKIPTAISSLVGSTAVAQLTTATPTKALTPTQTVSGLVNNSGKDYTFTNLNLTDIKDNAYILFTEKIENNQSKYHLQLSAMDGDGQYLGPLIKFVEDNLYCFTGTPDGSWVAMYANDQIQIFDMVNKKNIYIPLPGSDNPCDDLSLSPDGKYLAVGCGGIYFAEAPDYSWHSIVKYKGIFGYIDLSFSLDGKWLFSIIPGFGMGEDPATGIYVTDMSCIENQKNCDDSTRTLLSYAGLPLQVYYPTWSNDSQNIAFVHNNDFVSTINITQGKEIIHLHIPQDEKTNDLNEIAWSPDNKTIAYRLKNDVLLYDIEKEQHIKIRENVDTLLFWIKR
jgi:WD40 repeat protein